MPKTNVTLSKNKSHRKSTNVKQSKKRKKHLTYEYYINRGRGEITKEKGKKANYTSKAEISVNKQSII